MVIYRVARTWTLLNPTAEIRDSLKKIQMIKWSILAANSQRRDIIYNEDEYTRSWRAKAEENTGVDDQPSDGVV